MRYEGRCILPDSVADRSAFLQPYREWSPFVIEGDRESSVGTAIWRGGAAMEQIWNDSRYGQERAVRLYDRITRRFAWAPAAALGERIFMHLVERAKHEPWFIAALAGWYSDDRAILARACWAYARLIDVICERHYIMEDGPELMDVPPPRQLREFVGEDAIRCRIAASETLRRCEEPLDEWHCEATVARMLCPRLALFVVGMPYWLTAPEPGMTNLERQAATATGSKDPVERTAVKMKKAFQRRLGYQPDTARPGPRRGSSRPTDPARRALEDYVIDRNRHGISAQIIPDDDEAQRLYRAWKRDHVAGLTDTIVSKILRKHSTKNHVPEDPRAE